MSLATKRLFQDTRLSLFFVDHNGDISEITSFSYSLERIELQKTRASARKCEWQVLLFVFACDATASAVALSTLRSVPLFVLLSRL